MTAGLRPTGARLLSRSTEPHGDVRVHADPAGHPSCPFVRLGGREPSPVPEA